MIGKETFREKREQRRLGLQTFFMNIKNNHYDFVSNELIKDLEKKVALLNSQVEVTVRSWIDDDLNRFFR